MKKCPFCAEEIQDDARLCRFCKSPLPEPGGSAQFPSPPPSPTYSPPEYSQYPGQPHGMYPGGPKMIMPSNPPKDPLLMAMLSGCCIAGLGQIVVGQVTKGIVLLLCNIAFAFMTAGFGALVTWPLLAIDAYLVTKKLQSGQSVGEWEFFPSS